MTRFEVFGLPAPQGSKSAFVSASTGRTVVVEGKGAQRARHKSWRALVAEAARAAVDEPYSDAVEVSIVFRLPRPQSWPKRRQYATSRPDVDKLARSVLDSLTDGGALRDDSIVVRLHVEKVAVVGWTGAVITITELPEIAE